MEDNKELLEVFENLQAYMNTPKYIESPIIVKDKRVQHDTSLEYTKVLKSKVAFGNTYLSVEVKQCDSRLFSAKLMTDAIKSKMLLRYDSSGKTHRNNFDDIPLVEQQVTTPHIHYFDNSGRFLAKKTAEILADEDKAREIKYGFPIFCKEGNIYGELSTTPPKIQVGEEAILPFELTEIDPCVGVKF